MFKNSNPMMGMLQKMLPSLITDSTTDKLKLSIDEQFAKFEKEQNGDIVLSIQRTSDKKDICVSFFVKHEGKTELFKKQYLSELNANTIKNLIPNE